MSDIKDLGRSLGAGVTCGCTVVALFNPLDCMRIRWQTYKSPTSFGRFGMEILRTEGLWTGLWRPGLVSNTMAAAFSVGIRTGSYSFVRDGILNALGPSSSKNPAIMIVSGMLPGSVGYLMSTPFWQFKAIQQAEAGLVKDGLYVTGNKIGHKPSFSGLKHGLTKVFRESGIRGLYKGALPLTLRGGMLSAGQFLGYDGTKTLCKKWGVLGESPALHILASINAAFLACTFSAPFDILLTRYQTSATMGRHFASPMHCARVMVKEEGPWVFYRGWGVFFGRVAPVFCTMMPLYEQVRFLFGLGYMD